MKNFKEAIASIRTAAAIFYGTSFLLVFQHISKVQSLKNLPPDSALWIVKLFLAFFSPEVFFHFVLWLSIASFFLSSLLVEKRVFRILSFIAISLLLASKFSFGRIDRSQHIFLFISFIFIFLPNTSFDKTIKNKLRTVFILNSAQAFVMFAYSLSGLWKLVSGLQSFLHGKITFFDIDGFAVLLATRNMELGGNQHPIYANVIIDHLWLGPMLLTSCILLELLALPLMIFCYKYIRVFGLIFLTMHLGNILIVGISFQDWVLPLAIIFLAFRPSGVSSHNIFYRGRFFYYKSLKVFRVLSLFLLVHFALSSFFYLHESKITEVFPIFSWDLFSEIPPRQAVDYICIVKDIDGVEMDFSTSYPLLPGQTVVSPYLIVQKLGQEITEKKMYKKDEHVVALESLFITKKIQSYKFFRRTFNVLEMYKTGRTKQLDLILSSPVLSH